MNVEIGRLNIIIMFWKLGGCAVSFLGIHKSDFQYSVASELCKILAPSAVTAVVDIPI
jgi:hypothetical protein